MMDKGVKHILFKQSWNKYYVTLQRRIAVIYITNHVWTSLKGILLGEIR